MASTVITGLTGSITLPDSLTQRLNSISINGGQALADISAYGGNGWVDRIGLIKDLNGSASGFLEKGSAGNSPGWDTITPNGGTMTITFDPGSGGTPVACSITFTAIIGNIRVVGSYEGVNVVTFDWSKGIGMPTVSWQTS